jgi:DNA repair exonuclease SbcCD ATPase subunit
MLRFKKLRWRNFLSTGNYWSEIELSGSQNTLVVGENGSGKSTMLDALCFVLYNKPFRDINKGALINSINLKDCGVEVEFTTDNHEYKVARGIKPDNFEIFKDDVLVDQTSSGDYQDHLERFILKLNYKSFTQIVILGSASFTPFMQLKASDRREVIEDLLDIQIFSRMNKIVKGKLSTLSTERNSNKIMIEGAAEKIAMQERYIAEAKQDVKQRIQEHETERGHNTQEINRLKMEISIHTRAVQDLSAKITDKPKVTAASKKITQLEAQIETVLGKHRKNHKFYETEENCPTCIQVIDAAFKKQQLEQLGAKIGECETGLTQLTKKWENTQTRLSEIQQVESEISGHELVVAGHNTSVKQLEKFNAKLDEKIEGFKTHHESTGREQIRLAEHQEELTNLETSKKNLIEETAYYDAAGTLLKDTGIKTKIIRQYLPIINTLGNKYLASMDFFVNFNLDETFKETIKSRHRDDFTYHSFSEGEKQRIDMALVLTWRAVAKLKNSADTNLLILDEIFDSSLDNTGAEELMKILHSLEATNVFVISHRGDILQDKFQSVVKFNKQQNFSHIVI